MSRQLPTLFGRKACTLRGADGAAAESPESLVRPCGAIPDGAGVFVDAEVECERLRIVLQLLEKRDARLSLDKKICCLVRGAESSRIVSNEELLCRRVKDEPAVPRLM